MSSQASGPAGRKAPFIDIVGYATGDGVNSLVLNTIAGFSMLYYTEALHLPYTWAAWAMFAATVWDAVTDPVMGHVTDNTRSRFGRRHPYMLIGGILSVICFYFIWAVPDALRGSNVSLFVYLVVINLLLRTSLTVFTVSHGALGFEICTDYTQRSTLQGVKVGFNMLVNFCGPAMAWMFFFREKTAASTATAPAATTTAPTTTSAPVALDPTAFPERYVPMAIAFSVAALALVLVVTFATRKYIVDTRQSREIEGNDFGTMLRDLRDTLLDRFPRTVFLFMGVVMMGAALVSSLQMYVYVHFMRFPAVYKTLVHGSTMVACGLGGVISPLLVARLDKKPAVYAAVGVTVIANVMLTLLFVTGWVPPDLSVTAPARIPLVGGCAVPVSMPLFLVFHASYWFGNGVLSPIAMSMMADVSEIWKYRTGVLKDGAYSAMLSFVVKASISAGLLISGYCLAGVGFDVDADVQSPAAIHRLAAVTFLAGAGIAFAAMLMIIRYPVTRAYMAEIKAAIAAREAGAMGEGSQP
jgi:GPH family glycoside/pentoside/hexuronide:cation symporter